MVGSQKKDGSKGTVRTLTALACAVLVAVAAFALWSAVRAERSVVRLKHSGDLVEAYLDLTRAVAIQDQLEEAVDTKAQRTAGREGFNVARERIEQSVAVLQRLGGRADRALGKRILRAEREYAYRIFSYFDALDAGDAKLAVTTENAADPASQDLQGSVSEGGPEQASIILREIDTLRDSQANSLRFLLISILIGIGVAVGLWLLLRSLRRRIDLATGEEIARLERAALTDSLTGIRNHRCFEEELARTLAEQREHVGGLSLVMIDLDGLKAVNDTEGHQAGDRALRAVATTLAETARSTEFVFRIGGDEFAALLPDTTTWDAFTFAQNLHDALAAGHDTARVSVGIAAASDGSTRDGLIEEADVALREAKTGNRATVLFLPGMAEAAADDAEGDRRHRGTLASALARAVDAKDSYTRSHSETVAELCAIIATNLGIEGEHMAGIRLAGLVHDVGKIGVPDAILQKPAALTAPEFEIIKTHSALGHKILTGTDLSREAPWVLHHHERLDGRGYPAGLAGADIPLESRIIHVADAYEAMTSDRPYRRGMPRADAIAELKLHTGSQFDADCVDALLRGIGEAAPEPKRAVTAA